MHKRTLTLTAVLVFCAITAVAQQSAPPPSPLTFWYAYTVNPGREEDFLNLVKTVGQPVRDKMMADGVVLAWGVEVPLLRGPGAPTHIIWFAVANWEGVEKVLNAMQAQLAKLAAEEAKAAEEARRNRQKPGMTTAERIREIVDASKTRDWLTRDVVFGVTEKLPPAGTLPYTRYGWVKVKPGKGAEYRRAWDKYNKPLYDKLVADGVVLGYGLAVEELRTEGDFTHFTWITTADLASLDRVIGAFVADRAARSEEERNAISELFASLTTPEAARSAVTHSIIFRVPGN